MYAITSDGYRAIASLEEALPGETVVAELPEWLVNDVAAAEQRLARNALLRCSDWTQLPDSPLTAEQKAAWGSYRQALRDLPAQAGFPEVSWPTPPDMDG
jgi:hypothetical protein